MVSNTFSIMQMNSSSAQYEILQDIDTTTASTSGVYGLNFNLLDYNNLLLSFNYSGTRGNGSQCGLKFDNCNHSYNISSMCTDGNNNVVLNKNNVTPSTSYWYVSSALYNYSGNYQMFLKSVGGNIYLAYGFIILVRDSSYSIYYFDIFGTLTFSSQPTTLTTHYMNRNGNTNSIANTSNFKIYGAK